MPETVIYKLDFANRENSLLENTSGSRIGFAVPAVTIVAMYAIFGNYLRVNVTQSMPVGPAEYQSGRLTLTNGANLRVSGTATSMSGLRVGDSVVVYYGNLRNRADAPSSRSTTVLDLRSGGFFGSLIGEWPAS